MNPNVSLSTRWNTRRHGDGEAMIAEIVGLGFSSVELGYDLTLDLVPGVRTAIARGLASVSSVHNFCPVPPGAPQGHPELFSLCAANERERQNAVRHTANSIRFAAELGAPILVAHAGQVAMRNRTEKLIRLVQAGKKDTPKYERTLTRAIAQRDAHRQKHLDALAISMDELAPLLAEHRMVLALENLPSWESLPNEPELLEILQRGDGSPFRYWHDFGHAGIRAALGLADQEVWLGKLADRLAGFHLHESSNLCDIHAMPPSEKNIFWALKTRPNPDTVLVFEPHPGTDSETIRIGLQRVQQAAARDLDLQQGI